MTFVARYGPVALVAGASEGLGEAFARALAKRGVALLLVARRAAPLEALASELRAKVAVECLVGDLSDTAFVAALCDTAATRDIGLLIYNAAFAPEGAFVEQSLLDLQRAVATNCSAPLALAHALLPRLQAQKRGGILVMSSLAGLQGAPKLAVYSATKAFGRTLAEALWAECRGSGVDVLACAAGAVTTPGFLRSGRTRAPGQMLPQDVVQGALQRLSRGPLFVPGWLNRFAAFLLARILSRRAAIRLIGAQS